MKNDIVFLEMLIYNDLNYIYCYDESRVSIYNGIREILLEKGYNRL